MNKEFEGVLVGVGNFLIDIPEWIKKTQLNFEKLLGHRAKLVLDLFGYPVAKLIGLVGGGWLHWVVIGGMAQSFAKDVNDQWLVDCAAISLDKAWCLKNLPIIMIRPVRNWIRS